MYPCIILCGGLGTRLGSLVDKTPKCLLDINGEPFLKYQINFLQKNQIDKVYLSVCHMSKQFVEFSKNFTFKNIEIKIINDGKSPLGTGGAIKKALGFINSPAFVIYGDSLLDIDLQKVRDSYQLGKGPLMTIYKNNNKYDKSNVFLQDNKIIYSKKNPNPLAKYIDYGLGIYEKNYFNYVSEKNFDLSIIQEFYSKKHQLQCYEAKNRFYEIGTKLSYQYALKHFSK